jgi:glycosyltransferase involved in cell wall biosynthesis
MRSPDSLPVVGVVIPVYNDWPRLQQCLAALAVQRYPRALMRVRVVNNGSSDWPAQPSFPLPVEVIDHAPPGSYGARNRAALDWSVAVLAFTDADCRPDPDWLRAGVRALQLDGPRARLVAGRIVLEAARPDWPTPAEQLDQILGFDQARTVRRAGFGVTANLFVAQACFARLGGFHSGTRSGGDRDFCQRAVAAGVALSFSPEALVHHPARDWQELVHKQRRIVGGRLALAGASLPQRAAVLLLSMRPIVSECLRVLRRRRLSWPRRLLLCALVLRLRAAVLLEWLRLQRPGRDPLR